MRKIEGWDERNLAEERFSKPKRVPAQITVCVLPTSPSCSSFHMVFSLLFFLYPCFLWFFSSPVLFCFHHVFFQTTPTTPLVADQGRTRPGSGERCRSAPPRRCEPSRRNARSSRLAAKSGAVIEAEKPPNGRRLFRLLGVCFWFSKDFKWIKWFIGFGEVKALASCSKLLKGGRYVFVGGFGRFRHSTAKEWENCLMGLSGPAGFFSSKGSHVVFCLLEILSLQSTSLLCVYYRRQLC